MNAMTDAENVRKQYADEENLRTRMSLHEKYSTNPYGFFNWLFELYRFPDNSRILELGSGTGGIWENRMQALPETAELMFSDLSDGMVEGLREKFGGYPRVSVQKIDIQAIPFSTSSFDAVIANHMLYHVPDIDKALSEVNRVLKDTGTFYCSTNSDGGMRAYLHHALKQANPALDAFRPGRCSFTLENGLALLLKHFAQAQRFDYHDSLEITETRDLISWLESTISIGRLKASDLSGLTDYFEKIRRAEGAIRIPKLSGCFVCAKR